MRKNYVFRTAMCLGIVAMLTLCGASGTYAKYTGTVDGKEDAARVARFDFKFNTQNLSTSDATHKATVNLFSANFYDTKGTSSLVAETDVTVGPADYTIVAPGTWGFAAVTVENLSEVTITPSFTATDASGAITPLKYAISSASPTKFLTDGKFTTKAGSSSWKSLSDAMTELNAEFASLSKAAIGGATGGGIQTAYVVWCWPYDADDTTDNSLGIMADTDSVAFANVTISCTATQED